MSKLRVLLFILLLIIMIFMCPICTAFFPVYTNCEESIRHGVAKRRAECR